MAGEYVFNLTHLSKQYDAVTVLDDITLAFFFGAKIGVIGGNGAGKSSLLKIIAGLDKEYHGECIVAPGIRVGYLPQEPQLDETKDVAGNVAEGAAAAQGDAGIELLKAAGDGDVLRIKALLADGAPLEARDEDGNTPLLRATLGNHEVAASVLMKAGADVNAKNRI